MAVINYHICDSLSKNVLIITLPESWFQTSIQSLGIAFLSIIEWHHEPGGNMEDSLLKEYTATYISWTTVVVHIIGIIQEIYKTL